MVWFWDLLILFGVIFFVWLALSNQAKATEPAAHGHHSSEHDDHGVEPDHAHSSSTSHEEHASEIVSLHQHDSTQPTEEIVPPAPQVIAEPIESTSVAPAEVVNAEIIPDDLVKIEGIGPKISAVLNSAGILTFKQLADSTPEQIAQILAQTDPRLARIADPASWPAQARLAAAGELQALADLQSNLKGGRA